MSQLWRVFAAIDLIDTGNWRHAHALSWRGAGLERDGDVHEKRQVGHLLACRARNQNPQGGAVFLFRLFIALGFLLFGCQRFAATPQACRADTEHSA